jgi:hypothetical protein
MIMCAAGEVSLRSAPPAFQHRSVNLVTLVSRHPTYLSVRRMSGAQMERRFDMVTIANTVYLAGYVAVTPEQPPRAVYFGRVGIAPNRAMLACPAETRVYLP